MKNDKMLRVDEVLNGRLIPVHVTAQLIEYLTGKHNIPLPVLLKEGGLTIQEIMNSSTRIPAIKFIKIIRFALRTTKENGLGILFGKNFGPNSFHIMGHAAIAQASLRDSLKLVTRYYKTTAFLTEISLIEQDSNAIFTIMPLVFLGNEEDFIIDAIVTGFIAELNKFGFPTSQLSIFLAKPKPSYSTDYNAIQAKLVTFDCPQHSVVFPRTWLDRPLITNYDIGNNQPLIDICNQNLERAEQAMGCVERIKDSLRQSVGQMPNLEDVAASYHQSTRSLQRSLRVEGQSFRKLVEEVRKERAQHLLLQTNMSIVEIALELGYSEPPNFTRAFKQWFGSSPQHYRSRLAVMPERVVTVG